MEYMLAIATHCHCCDRRRDIRIGAKDPFGDACGDYLKQTGKEKESRDWLVGSSFEKFAKSQDHEREYIEASSHGKISSV